MVASFPNSTTYTTKWTCEASWFCRFTDVLLSKTRPSPAAPLSSNPYLSRYEMPALESCYHWPRLTLSIVLRPGTLSRGSETSSRPIWALPTLHYDINERCNKSLEACEMEFDPLKIDPQSAFFPQEIRIHRHLYVALLLLACEEQAGGRY